jgi:hypothetical protein
LSNRSLGTNFMSLDKLTAFLCSILKKTLLDFAKHCSALLNYTRLDFARLCLDVTSLFYTLLLNTSQ